MRNREKRIITKLSGMSSLKIIKILISVVMMNIAAGLYADILHQYPFSTDSSHLTIWNGTEYVPFFIKGINMGVAVPGTFPGEMAATRNDYDRWFRQIKDAGFNCIRLYTLHYPRFYEALYDYNQANPQNPLFFFHGVWLEEELSGYDHDLYFLTESFRQEIEDNIDCVHGNKTIAQRLGKAYGTYSVDVSPWCIGYIIGREVYGIEVLTTNDNHPTDNQYAGNHFSISDATAAEVWFTRKLDHTVHYEQTNYNTQRPVSNSSWPTLDPMRHPEEVFADEDTASVNLSKIELTNAPAGLFISYHAYPYYPGFVSEQSSYLVYYDDYGPNSYLGYLNDLKSHYKNLPLIIAEYGVPSSWTIAHFASSGMNHGGFDEYNQGLTNLRLLETVRKSGSGGGIQFAWIDEWFKRTWITDPIDYIADSRILWHNMAAAEQNYGLIGYQETLQKDTLESYNPSSEIRYIHAEVNYSYFELEIGLKNPMDLPGEMWIALDTYDENLGESKLPSGETIPSRSEFALTITNYSATLYVTEAYDIFGIWHNFSGPNQLFRSVPTDGAPWEIVRVRNNSFHSDVQYIGQLNVNYSFQPPSSTDGVVISDDKIKIRIPWFYLNVVAPNQMRVFHDDRSTPEKEDIISDGFAVSVLYKDQWFVPSERYVWNEWHRVTNPSGLEYLKSSYYVMKDNLNKFNTPAIAVRDTFYFHGTQYPFNVGAEKGLLANDFDIDGDYRISLVSKPPLNGEFFLNNDGSFSYYPKAGFTGYDSLSYYVYDGYDLSTPNVVVIYSDEIISDIHGNDLPVTFSLSPNYPNPFNSSTTIEYTLADQAFVEIKIYNTLGNEISTLIRENKTPGTHTIQFHGSSLSSGIYYCILTANNQVVGKNKMVLIK